MRVDASGSHDAIHKCVGLLKDRGLTVNSVVSERSVGSGFGTKPRDFTEILGVTIHIANPRDRLLPTGCAPFHPGYAFANFLWSVTPDAPASQILEYNPSGAKFLDGKNVFQCGVPQRLSGSADAMHLEALIGLLERDPTSRRAIIPLIRIGDVYSDPADFPCISSFQVLQRDGKLHAITHMRSQSAVAIMAYDIYLFTMLQEYLSLRLHLAVGEYIHMCNSLHFYVDDLTRMRRLAACSKSSEVMDGMDAPEALRDGALSVAEREIRAGTGIVDRRRLSPYWLSLVTQLSNALGRQE